MDSHPRRSGAGEAAALRAFAAARFSGSAAPDPAPDVRQLAGSIAMATAVLLVLLGCTQSSPPAQLRGEPSSEPPPATSDSPPGPGEARPAAETLLEADWLEHGGPVGAVNRTGAEFAALTFDDGPHPVWTPKVLERLRAYGVTATFCMVGVQAEAHPDLVRAVVEEGHTLCNHSWDHDFDLGERSIPQIRADLERAQEAILDAAPDAPVVYYRQPGGAWNEPIARAAAEIGLTPLHWSVDPVDWRDSNSAKTISTAVAKETGVGDIVLLHDGGGDRKRTWKALDELLPDLEKAEVALEPLP